MLLLGFYFCFVLVERIFLFIKVHEIRFCRYLTQHDAVTFYSLVHSIR